LPPDVARQAQREMARLRRLPTGSAEAGQVRAYLQWLWSVPWDVLATEAADLKRVESDLHREHLGLLKAKERVMEYLAVRRLNPTCPRPRSVSWARRNRQVVARRGGRACAASSVRPHQRLGYERRR
jgi:ATP-dependent Lon protease